MQLLIPGKGSRESKIVYMLVLLLPGFNTNHLIINIFLCRYFKIKLFSLFSGKDSTLVSEDECSTELDKVKTDMVKAFDYSEGDYYCYAAS